MTYQEKHVANLKKVHAIKDDELRVIWVEQLERAYAAGLAGEDRAAWLDQIERDAGNDYWSRYYVATCRTGYNAGLEARA